MARSSQAYDAYLRRVRELGQTAGTMLRRALPYVEYTAAQAGLLDLPVDPVRSRRTLGVAAVAYVVGVIAGLIIWRLLPK